ncbi:hypothetical protein HH310_28850 [Actinoplanes sp. TBRC 11911]|uniref:hypothetical protein n=1 Tax=Actinoplanes sp. TBRC 11911 TaxID=2729386 RepID=UPI00145E82EF|nr:hypothetical protein [Actinoplanes sp. TBRC 11911]NMO55181.1 hypothetical protein [Actinoplanes sp. TBRC 11911]
MTIPLTGPAARSSDVQPGTVPAWAVVFFSDGPGGLKRLLAVGSDTYDGSVSATLPFELEGGRYEVVIEGLTDSDYQRVRAGGRVLAAEIHLWWCDTTAGVLGDLARATGLGDLVDGGTRPPADSLVATIRVDSMRRQAGERRYDTVLSGRERVVARLGETRMAGTLTYKTLPDAVDDIARRAGISVRSHGVDTLPKPGKDQNAADVRPGSALQAMRTVRDQVLAGMKLQGLPAALIRDGVLHLGEWTADKSGVKALPVDRTLDAAGGLVSAERGADADPREATAGPPPPSPRAKVTATALGRPDLKPGDRVSIPLPPEDYPDLAPTGAGLPLLRDLDAVLGPDAEQTTLSPCLVTQVTHRLSRRQGFVTTIQAVVPRQPGDDGWDKADDSTTGTTSTGREQRGSKPADHASGAAGAVEGVAKAIAQRAGLQLRSGQVRGHGGNPPEQNTSEIWYAVTPRDGLPDELRRVAINPKLHGALPEVPVVTPFAFGGYGLVLPRYPGSRVLLADQGGGAQGVVDIGGVWEDGVCPPAEAGDWWLVLPIGQAVQNLGPAADAEPPASADASHDLIDAQGRRLLETAGFTVRVVDAPTPCDQRPQPAKKGSVVIESTKDGKSARVELKNDGSITITGTSISLDAGTGDITMNAANVRVQVTGTMDVS